MGADDLLRVTLPPSTIATVCMLAGHAALGGTSHVRAGDRGQFLGEDQRVGQVGEAAWSWYLTGSDAWYRATRAERDAFPHRGDAGQDLLGQSVDVKCSLMRSLADPLRYHLLVRPAERVAGTVYVLALVQPGVWESGEVWLVGWLAERALPERVATRGPWAGAYAVPARDLQPLPPWTVQAAEGSWSARSG